MNTDFGSLVGKKVLITAGPTREKIDDVRYISNHSTGKMGYAIAQKAYENGAKVTLISGPVNIPEIKGIKTVKTESAEEMFNAALKYFEFCDIAILSAAVADYTPILPKSGKIKKEDFGDSPILELIKTKDILKTLGNKKNDNQILVGFALESDNLIINAQKKLITKNCDMIVANKANIVNSGFGGDNNTITLLLKDGSIKDFLPMSKIECAEIILNEIAILFNR